MKSRLIATLEFQAPRLTPEPPPARCIEARTLEATLNDRQRFARIEFARWREENPDFTHKELLDNWRRIRIAWNLTSTKPRKTP